VEKAKKELSLLSKHQHDLEKTAKYILNEMEQRKYQKIEIEISEEEIHDNDTVHQNVVLDEKTNLFRRIDSVHLIKDRDVLIDTYKKCTNLFIKKEIISTCKLQEIYDLALHEKDFNLKVEAIKAINNDMKLKDEAEKNNNYLVRIEALKKLKGKDLNALQKIILMDKEPKVVKVALNQINSVAFLESFIDEAKPDTKVLIENRISVLTGKEDYLKKSVEDLISNYG
jgi:hypothetical protein